MYPHSITVQIKYSYQCPAYLEEVISIWSDLWILLQGLRQEIVKVVTPFVLVLQSRGTEVTLCH
uniref:Uncharacterized protein n=1 Tax=Amphimedon queenslandica TaxID=400682 RepID=A0A1X7UYK8_AMPQE